MKINTPLAFIDVETTGLHPDKGLLLEVGIVLTDEDLNVTKEMHAVVGYEKEDLDYHIVDPFVREMHEKNGLIDECLASDACLSGVELDLIMQIIKPDGVQSFHKPRPLAGACVDFDRRWLTRHMPTLTYLFHYRNFDVSTLRMVMNKTKNKNKEAPHRVLDDIYQDIADVRKFMEELNG